MKGRTGGTIVMTTTTPFFTILAACDITQKDQNQYDNRDNHDINKAHRITSLSTILMV